MSVLCREREREREREMQRHKREKANMYRESEVRETQR